MKERFLPIGSVVLLKEATRKVVIIGFAQVEEGNDEIWDYMGCAYPIGVVSTSSTLLFNHDKIDKVISLGYSDEEEKQFRKDLEINLQRIKEEKKNAINKL